MSYKMRRGSEPIPVGKRDTFRAVRGIGLGLAVSCLLWLALLLSWLWY